VRFQIFEDLTTTIADLHKVGFALGIQLSAFRRQMLCLLEDDVQGDDFA
jgi:hypothetical protein